MAASYEQPNAHALNQSDSRVLIAGLVLLFACSFMHLIAFGIRLWHHHSGLRKMWLVRLVKRPHGGSVIVFSPGLTWITFGFVICVAKGLHGSLKLDSEYRGTTLSGTSASGLLGFYMATFTMECLVSWIVWSSTLVQAATSYESFMAQSPQQASKQLWFLRQGRWWNMWFLGCPIIILPFMVTWITRAMVTYHGAINYSMMALAATDPKTAQFDAHKSLQLTKMVLKRSDDWIIMMICWISVTLITYGYATIKLLMAFKKEETFVARLKRGGAAINKPSFHDKHLELQGYQPNLPLVSARHSALNKKTRQLIMMNAWIFVFWCYILFCGVWFVSLSLEKKMTPRISEKSSLVADKFLLGILDLPVIMYLLWSSFRYGNKSPHQLANPHPLEYVYPKETSHHERNLVWGVDDQRATRITTRISVPETQLALSAEQDEKVDKESIISGKESL